MQSNRHGNRGHITRQLATLPAPTPNRIGQVVLSSVLVYWALRAAPSLTGITPAVQMALWGMMPLMLVSLGLLLFPLWLLPIYAYRSASVVQWMQQLAYTPQQAVQLRDLSEREHRHLLIEAGCLFALILLAEAGSFLLVWTHSPFAAWIIPLSPIFGVCNVWVGCEFAGKEAIIEATNRYTAQFATFDARN